MSIEPTIQLTDIFGNIIEKAWTYNLDSVLQANTGRTLYKNYIYGSPLEISTRLSEMTTPNTQNKRFPLFALVQNFKETNDTSGIYSKVDVVLWVMYPSFENGESYPKRYENTFVPILYPIKEYLIWHIRKSGYFHIDLAKGLEYEVTERPNWGRYIAGLGNTEQKLGTNVEGLEFIFKLRINENAFAVNKQNRVII